DHIPGVPRYKRGYIVCLVLLVRRTWWDHYIEQVIGLEIVPRIGHQSLEPFVLVLRPNVLFEVFKGYLTLPHDAAIYNQSALRVHKIGLYESTFQHLHDGACLEVDLNTPAIAQKIPDLILRLSSELVFGAIAHPKSNGLLFSFFDEDPDRQHRCFIFQVLHRDIYKLEKLQSKQTLPGCLDFGGIESLALVKSDFSHNYMAGNRFIAFHTNGPEGTNRTNLNLDHDRPKVRYFIQPGAHIYLCLRITTLGHINPGNFFDVLISGRCKSFSCLNGKNFDDWLAPLFGRWAVDFQIEF